MFEDGVAWTSSGLAFTLNGELVDVNPEPASVAPAWRAMMQIIVDWCAQHSDVTWTVATHRVPRGGARRFTSVRAKRLTMITEELTAGAIDDVIVAASGKTMESAVPFQLWFSTRFATREIKRERGKNLPYRRRTMGLTIERQDFHFDKSDFDLIAALTRAYASFIRLASGWASLLEFPSGRLPLLAPHVAEGQWGATMYNHDQLFGYDWVQLFTPPVIAALEASGRRFERLPVEAHVSIPVVDGTDALLAAVRKSPADVTDSDMRAFREFVLPALFITGPPRPGSAGAANYVGRPRLHGILPEDWFPDA